MDVVGWIPESMKLEGSSNYRVWAYRMKLVFIHGGLWDLIEPGYKPVPGSVVSSSLDVATPSDHSDEGEEAGGGPGPPSTITTSEGLRWISEGMKLEGASNYVVWADRMKRILMLEGVWEVVGVAPTTGSETNVTPSAEETNVTPCAEGVTPAGENKSVVSSSQKRRPITPEATALNPTGETSCPSSHIRGMQDKAMVLIALGVSDRVTYKIIDLFEPAAVWNELKASYESAADAAKRRLEVELMFLKLEEGMPFKEHFKNIHALLKQFANVGGRVEDSYLIERIVLGLTPSWYKYGSMVYCREPQMTFSSFKRLLLEEENRRNSEFRRRRHGRNQ